MNYETGKTAEDYVNFGIAYSWGFFVCEVDTCSAGRYLKKLCNLHIAKCTKYRERF